VSERKSSGKGASGTSGGSQPKAAGGAKGAAAKRAAPKPVARKPAAKAAPAAKRAPAAPAPSPGAPSAAAGAAATQTRVDASGRKQAFKRTLIGRVKSDKMNKTIVVEVIRSKMDPVYKKYVRTRKTYKAHDEENTCRIGDRVEIIEHRPLSKLKRWKLLNLVERAVQE
jgi:small subunit ribosomal protein S17